MTLRKTVRLRRTAMFFKQGGKCCYCDGVTFLAGSQSTATLMSRFGITPGLRGSRKVLRYHEATFEHIKRRADGGTYSKANGMMACAFCNVMRGPEDHRAHRIDMQRLVEAGRHPVNRRGKPMDNPDEFRKLTAKALRAIRAGKTLTEEKTNGNNDAPGDPAQREDRAAGDDESESANT